MVRSGVNEESLQYRQGLLRWMGINAERKKGRGVFMAESRISTKGSDKSWRDKDRGGSV